MRENPALELARLLDAADKAQESSYHVRNRAVIKAVAVALECGYPAGFAYDPNASIPEFPILAYIELPSFGQVSWHLPEYTTEWDGHTTDEKYQRCRDWISNVMWRHSK
jgi:hypothetical protein